MNCWINTCITIYKKCKEIIHFFVYNCLEIIVLQMLKYCHFLGLTEVFVPFRPNLNKAILLEINKKKIHEIHFTRENIKKNHLTVV